MRNVHLATAIAALMTATPALASSYIALGDSITFGETDLLYTQSYGDRGYVNDFADYLAARDNGNRPTVINLAIDGETTGSFVDNSGRTPPVAGRGDQPLQLENANYASTSFSQGSLFADAVRRQNTIGDPVGTITVTLGFNNLAALAAMPTEEALAAAPGVLNTYRAQYAGILSNIRSLTPDANLYLLGYYNPFPADPTSPGAPLFNTYGTELNDIIRSLAGQYGARYVDTASAFLGREAELTYLDEQPAGFVRSGMFGGVEPIGDVHPNEAGYAVIARQIQLASAVPEPQTWLMMIVGLGFVGALLRRRDRRVPATALM